MACGCPSKETGILPSGENECTEVLCQRHASNVAGRSAVEISLPVTSHGNRVVMSILVYNASSGTTVRFQLEGSYDGEIWFTIGSALTQGGFGYAHIAAGSIDYFLIRVKVDFSEGTNVEARFCVFLSFTAQ